MIKLGKPKKVNWESLIGLSDDDRPEPLGVGPPLLPTPGVCMLEITMNYPRTAAFKLATSSEQKRLYSLLWERTKIFAGISNVDIRSHYEFEQCKSGHVHLHAALYVKTREKFYPCGLVADCVKTYLKHIPKKYRVYNDAYMNSEFIKYRCPSICVSYTDLEDTERVLHWESYIVKDK